MEHYLHFLICLRGLVLKYEYLLTLILHCATSRDFIAVSIEAVREQGNNLDFLP